MAAKQLKENPMRHYKKYGLAGALLLLASTTAAWAQVPPQVQTLQPQDLFQDIVGGNGPGPEVFASVALLSGAFGQGSQLENFLIGGDAGQNLWQRASTGSSVTTTVTYGGPDRWAYWSGTNTAMTVSRSNTAAALPTGSQYAFRMQRTASQTGVVQMCMVQEIATTNAQYLAGHTALLDFNVYTGANFSATALNAYIITGTGTDEGVAGTSSLAYGLNAGGGGSGSWTGQANATAGAYSSLAVSTAYRVAAVANIPTTATEVAVALCYTPTTTSAGTTDALYFQNIELRKADWLSQFANATTAYTVTTNAMNPSTAQITASINGITQNAIIPAFSRRNSSVEAYLQYAYYYQWNDNTTAGLPIGPAGYYNSTTACQINFPLPAPLFKAPTIVNSAITASTFTVAQSGGTPAAGAALAGSGNSGLILTVGSNTNAVTTVPNANFNYVSLSFITAAKTQYAACQLLSTNVSTAAFGVSSEL